MFQKKIFVIGLPITLFVFTLLIISSLMTAPVQAQSPNQDVDNGTCITCHEDLYFNHDTGHWFCVSKSPMACVSCHGGDPTVTTKEDAHYDRSAHPVVDEDISVCQRCHTEDCFDCVSEFGQVAGIKDVKLAAPDMDPCVSDQPLDLPITETREPVNWILLIAVLTVIVVISLSLALYAAKKVPEL